MTSVSSVIPGQRKARIPNTIAAIPRSSRSHQRLVNALNSGAGIWDIEIAGLPGMALPPSNGPGRVGALPGRNFIADPHVLAAIRQPRSQRERARGDESSFCPVPSWLASVDAARKRLRDRRPSAQIVRQKNLRTIGSGWRSKESGHAAPTVRGDIED